MSPTRDTSARRNYSNSNAVPPSQVDALALARVLATLTIQARAGTDSLRVNAGRIADINGGVVGVTPACQGCDVVIAHGSEALDNDLLSPESFGLSPTEVLSVFVDAVPQVGCWAIQTEVNTALSPAQKRLAVGALYFNFIVTWIICSYHSAL